jgi:hypothetical protein
VSCDARFDQRFLFFGQWVIVIEPTVAIEFGELHSDLMSFL